MSFCAFANYQWSVTLDDSRLINVLEDFSTTQTNKPPFENHGAHSYKSLIKFKASNSSLCVFKWRVTIQHYFSLYTRFLSLRRWSATVCVILISCSFLLSFHSLSCAVPQNLPNNLSYKCRSATRVFGFQHNYSPLLSWHFHEITTFWIVWKL